jgi:2-hydroxychromene-2-carboxylate isomerase
MTTPTPSPNAHPTVLGMAPTVQFLFDFGSPNAYLCHKVIPDIEARCGVRFDYEPVLLGGLFKLANNRSPVEAFASIPSKLAYDRLEMKRFIVKHGLTAFQMNPFFPVNTLAIMRGAVAAQQLDCYAPYVEAVYAAMWEQGRNMGEPSTISAVLDEAGLDAARLLAVSQQADVKNGLMANTQSAYNRGAFGSPTFFVGEDMFFGKDRLPDVEQAIVRATAA